METRKHHPLYEAIGAIVGSKYVTDEDFALIPYSRDVSAFAPVKPGIVVRPGSTEEVSEIVKLANRTGFPVTLKGGGQSAGGITKGEPARNIVLDLGRLDKVFDIDVENQKVTYGAGIRPSMLDDALRDYGYFVHSVIGPYFTASMGGILSGVNGGGVNVSGGYNWRHILGLKVVLPTGEIITTGAGPDTNVNRTGIDYREATAPDLTNLFLSSGGAFGIITEVTQLMYPIPKISKSGSFLFSTMEDVWNVQLELSKTTPPLYSGIIMHDMPTMAKFGVRGVEGYGLFFSVQGNNQEDVDLRLKGIEKICLDGKGQPGTPEMVFYGAHGCTGTAEIVHEACSNSCPFMTWELAYPRKGSLEFCKKLLYVFDKHEEENAKYGASRVFYSFPIANAMLIGVTLHWNDAVPGAGDYVRKVWKEGVDFILKEGTSVCYAQGSNSNLVSSVWSPAFSKFIGGIKKTLDPNNILCPGLWNL
ncbi:FAD-binding oxidoreductase [Calorimonas adulescens]|uniref:FAD-binding oxidoreductase n=1 Tax=Calorimonas adulescens TaxID=2606906 RepID=A0A5D8QDC0_9THEO|nr:FAD-binding oxidoreductase [Calorimonas adulescens]TZE82522.1 FAD-binding oxidoreductase [Calorimonas adulescens]